MNKGINLNQPKVKYTLLVLLIIAVEMLGRMNMKKNKDKTLPLVIKNNIALPLRTVNASDNSQRLFAYQLISDQYFKDGEGMVYQEYSAIIEEINPGKDDYKAYCISVIKDILKMTTVENVTVNIYDSYEAYEYSEFDFGKTFKGVSKEEMDSIDKHTVAEYSCVLGYESYDHTLWFYPQAKNAYTEKVMIE
jgi:hypothetical protein